MRKLYSLKTKQLAFVLAVILAVFGSNGQVLAQSAEKQLLTFSIKGIDGAVGTINQTTYTVSVTVPFSTDLTSLVANFTKSTGATVSVGGVVQVSGTTPNDFTNTVTYTVTAENGSTRNYYVTVSKAVARSEKLLLTFKFESFTPDIIGVINQTNHSVNVVVPFSADVTNLAATFTSSTLSTVWVGAVQQVSGTTTNDFTNQVVYTVRAEDGSTQNYAVSVTRATASSLKDITQFSFTNLDPAANGVIDQVQRTIKVTVPFAANLATLVATFTNSPYSAVTVGGVAQVSGTTINDFTTNVVYRVTAEDNSTKDYTVEVTKLPASTANQILTFSFAALIPPVTGVVNETNKSISLTVPWVTDVTNLVATFTHSPLSIVKVGGVTQVSGTTANDFTNPVQYYCFAEDQSLEIYTVTVTKVPVSTANSILTFGFVTQFEPDIIGTINQTNKTIAVTVPFSTNLTTLVASFTSSPLSTVWVGGVQQTSATTVNNFTNPVAYVCRAQDGSEEIYTVTVTKTAASSLKALLTFSFQGLATPVSGIINETTKTVSVQVPFSTDVTSLIATFTSSPLSTVTVGGVAQVSGTTTNNFTNPVTYRVTAEDLTTADYVVTVTKTTASSAKSLLTFRFNALDPDVIGVIDEVNHAVSVTVPYGTVVTNLVATFTSSSLSTVWIGAVQQVSGTTANNFTNPVVYKVIAENGTEQNYTVTVTVTPISSAKQITAFSFAALNPVVTGVINQDAKTIVLTVPYGTNVTALVATFTASPLSTVSVGGVAQTSGTTANNFTAPITYRVTAQNGSTADYIVTVIIYQMEKKFLSFGFTGTFNNGFGTVSYNSIGTIDHATRTIQVNIPNSVSRTSLAATYTLSNGVSAYIGVTPQASGITINNFTSVVTYTLLATDGSTTTYQVSVVNNPIEASKQILTFAFAGLNPPVTGTIDQTNRTIAVLVPFNTNRSSLVATFTHSNLSLVKIAGVVQQSGVTTNDYTNPVTYTVVAEDGTSQTYVVTVTLQAASSAKDITYFAFEDLNPDAVGVINQAAQTITVVVPAGTNVTALVAYYIASPLTTVRIRDLGIQASGLTVNDFTNSVVYQVYAQDGSVKEYLVTVTEPADVTPPVVSNLVQSKSNQAGNFALVRSNEATGKVYIIKTGVPQTTIANFDAAVAAHNGADALVTAANTDIAISTYNLNPGTYYAYAVDMARNISAKGTNQIIIRDESAPTATVTAQTISNAYNHVVNVRSSDPSGIVYLILDGEAHTSKTDLERAVSAGKGQKNAVTAANTDIPISVWNLIPGNYHAFAVDDSPNLNVSDPSTNTVVITQASRLKSIVSFTFNQLNPPAIAQIIGTSITVIVPVGTDVTNLIASFTLSPLAKAFVGLVEQVSGVTPNNFISPVFYTVEAEDGSTLEYEVRVFFNTGIEDLEWFDMVNVYPNPFNEVLNIQTPVPADKIEVINSLGQTKETVEQPMQTTLQISTSTWSRGIYLVRFYRDSRLVGIKKVMK